LRRLVGILSLATAAACKSTAPYAVPSAALNTGIAAGFSAAQRTLGGCYATCAHGTACNPHTGFCEKLGTLCACPSGELCLEGPGGVPKCVQPAMTIFSEQQQSSGALIVRPESGVVPVLPVPVPP
jgi:hypothetical protein